MKINPSVFNSVGITTSGSYLEHTYHGGRQSDTTARDSTIPNKCKVKLERNGEDRRSGGDGSGSGGGGGGCRGGASARLGELRRAAIDDAAGDFFHSSTSTSTSPLHFIHFLVLILLPTSISISLLANLDKGNVEKKAK